VLLNGQPFRIKVSSRGNLYTAKLDGHSAVFAFYIALHNCIERRTYSYKQHLQTVNCQALQAVAC
jgi:hypothetical protein